MEPTSSKNEMTHNTQKEIDTLSEQMQQWCLSGKSVSDTAHLVKNIIQMVSGAAEVMELSMQRKQFDRVQRSWEIFGPNLKRLNKYLLDLIKYTRRYPIEKTTCNINDLVLSAVGYVKGAFKNNSVTIQCEQDKTIEQTSLDADCIEEMVRNLLTHALDNLAEQGGTVRIETKYLPDHQQIQISVFDDGPTLEEDMLRSLSQPFERAHAVYGTGFDIPLAKLYVEQHNGYMEFESRSPQVNCVHVYLPAQ